MLLDAHSPSHLDIVADLSAISSKYGKKVLFPEIGYRSVEKCASGPAQGGTDKLDLQCQKNAFEAFFKAIFDQSWFGGALFWAVRSDPLVGGKCDTNFDPRGKPAGQVLKDHSSRLPTKPKVDPMTVYRNGVISPPWHDESYTGTVDYKAPQSPPGEQYAIHADLGNWGAVALHRDAFDPADFYTLSFKALGSSSVVTQLQVNVINHGKYQPKRPATAYVDSCRLYADHFVDVEIPLVDLKGHEGNVTGLVFSNGQTKQGSFGLADIILK